MGRAEWRRSRLNPSPSKPQRKRLLAGVVADGRATAAVDDFVAQLEPAAMPRRLFRQRSSPWSTRERTFDFAKGRILPQREQCDAAGFRERQLELTAFAMTHQQFT